MMAGALRRGVALAATALAAVALAVGVGGRGCDSGGDSPAGAVRSFQAAARAGDREGMWQLLGPRTRRWLDDAAKRGSQMVGGQERYASLDLLGAQAPVALTRLTVREVGEGRAAVDFTDETGRSSSLSLVEVDGRWRLELK